MRIQRHVSGLVIGFQVLASAYLQRRPAFVCSETKSVKDHLAIGKPIDLQQYCHIINAGRTAACPPGDSIISDANGVSSGVELV